MINSLLSSRLLLISQELDGIISQLSGLFEIDLASIEDFKAYNYYQYSFPELFSAGTNIIVMMLTWEGQKHSEARTIIR